MGVFNSFLISWQARASYCIQEPFECYHMLDIEAGLGLKRKHLIAISLLVGSDHDLNGVQGIGLDTAVRFVRTFSEDEVLNRLHEIGGGDMKLVWGGIKSVNGSEPSSDESSPKTKFPHCSLCGHPGSKRAHLKFSCEYCGSTGEGCLKKPVGFRCDCSSCDMFRKEKDLKKLENWQIRVCRKIAVKQNFPNVEIIELYLGNNHGYFTANDDPCLSWESPKTEMLVDFLAYHQLWVPSYIRQRMLPMLSTISLREMASNPKKTLLYGQYEFDSIQRAKIRFSHQFYVVKWKKPTCEMGNVNHTVSVEESDIQQEESDAQEEEFVEVNESTDLLDEPNAPHILVDDGCWFLLTDENMELVQAAFPEEVNRFLQEKELKESRRRNKPMSTSDGSPHEKLESPKSKNVQLSITKFYRSTKVHFEAKPGEDLPRKEKRRLSSPNLSKSVRRRLLF